MKFTWKGHSCFLVEDKGFTVAFDPFGDDTVPGYAKIRVTADTVLCSHEHRDHGFRDGVKIVKSGVTDPFIVTSIECPHDDAGGAKRGMNNIYVLDDGELRFAHFGDIGCPLTDEQIAEIGELDLALVPVGGYYTMEPDGIYALMEKIAPKVVIPMHYRFGEYGYPVIGTLNAYLDLVKGDIVKYDTNEFELTKDTPAQTAVLTYLG